jgi:ATP synthase assembly factor FMC1
MVQLAGAYRTVLRELKKDVCLLTFRNAHSFLNIKFLQSGYSHNKVIAAHLRSIFEKWRQSESLDVSRHDVLNLITFVRSHREYKVGLPSVYDYRDALPTFYQSLLERYSPLVGLTTEERVHATARRVGLDMPVTHQPNNEE